MPASFFRTLTVFALAALALPMVGQDAGVGSNPSAVCMFSTRNMIESYTAEFKNIDVKTQANGTTITSEFSQVLAWDSQNRFMQSVTLTQPFGDHASMTMVNVQDVVKGTQITWNSEVKKAEVLKLPPKGQRYGCWQTPSDTNKINYPPARPSGVFARRDASTKIATATSVPVDISSKPVVEDLGTMMIQGIEAHGCRSTTTIPIGEIGNHQPLARTEEHWNATGIKLLEVHSVRDDPRTGKLTTELVKLDQSEPDPATFQPPVGYETVTEEMVPCKEQVTSAQ